MPVIFYCYSKNAFIIDQLKLENGQISNDSEFICNLYAVNILASFRKIEKKNNKYVSSIENAIFSNLIK